MTIITPPPTVNFGFVTGRFALAVADTAQDEDHLPNFVPASGTVTFRPNASKLITSTPTRYISPQPVTVNLNSAGAVADSNGLNGVWLVVGSYQVSFKLAGLTVSSFDVTVTVEHTQSAPLDLVLYTPAPVEPDVKFVVNEQMYLETVAAAERAEDAAVRAEAVGSTGGASINDASTATTSTWSSSKINTSLTGKAASTHTHVINDVSNATTVGKALLGAVDAAAARAAIGAGDGTGTSNVVIGTTAGTAADAGAVATALAGKADTTALAGYVPTTRTVAGKALSGNVTLAKADVGLGNVDNTTDAAKPVSTATQSALNGKLGSSNGTVADVIYVTTLPGTVVNGTLYLTPKA